MDSNRDKVLTQEGIKQALDDQELILRDDQFTHLMAFFDLHGRGYVTLGDFNDSLKRFRARQQRVQVNQQMTASISSQMSIQKLPMSRPFSSSVTRLQSALRAPLVLFTTPVPDERWGKRQWSTTKTVPKRILEQEVGISYLDITDPEIDSLVNYLMGVGNCGNGEEDFGRAKEELPPKPTEYSPSANAHQSQLRPLSLVMSALESAASRSSNNSNSNGGKIESVRGPGAAAVPSSAARVMRILRVLQKMWHRTDRLHRAKKTMQRAPDEFSDEELSAAVGLFDVDGKGGIYLEDVITVFQNVRAGKFTRRRPPTAAIPSLGALGRYLENRRITAQLFIQEAAMSAVTTVDLVESCGQSENTMPAPKGEQIVARNKAQPATTAQLGALLCSEVNLSAQQRNFILECVEDSGFVSGANLAWAVQQAKGELSHRKLARLKRKRGMAGSGGGCGSREKAYQVSETTVAGSGHDITSPPSYRQESVAAAAEAGACFLPQHQHHCRRNAPPQQDVFNQSDTALVLDLFAQEGGGLSSLTGDTAVALWRGLKRRSRGLHAYETGCLASRRLRHLLRGRRLQPEQWFATLDTVHTRAAGAKDVSVVARSVPTSSIIHGVKTLVQMTAKPQGKVSTVATAAAAVVDDDGTATSVEGSLSDEAIEHKLGDVGRGKKWTKTQLSALACHLDPCGEGSITQVALQEGLGDCYADRAVIPDAVHLAAVCRFEAALQDLGCKDICGLLRTLAGKGRGGGDLVEYVRQIGDCARDDFQELDAAVSQEQEGKTLAMRQCFSTNETAVYTNIDCRFCCVPLSELHNMVYVIDSTPAWHEPQLFFKGPCENPVAAKLVSFLALTALYLSCLLFNETGGPPNHRT